MVAERNQKETNSVCFFCTHWQPTTDEGIAKRDELLGRKTVYSPPAMDGTCQAAKDPRTYLRTRGGYAHVESFDHHTSPQYPCDIGIKEGTFLGLGGKIVPAFEPHPNLKKST